MANYQIGSGTNSNNDARVIKTRFRFPPNHRHWPVDEFQRGFFGPIAQFLAKSRKRCRKREEYRVGSKGSSPQSVYLLAGQL